MNKELIINNKYILHSAQRRTYAVNYHQKKSGNKLRIEL